GFRSAHHQPEQRRRDPAARLRRLPGAAGGHRRRRLHRARGGLPAHRHRRDVRQRAGGRRGGREVRDRPERDLRDQQAQQRLPPPGRRAPGVRPVAGRARLRPARPVPHPLAAAGDRRRLRGDVEGAGGDLRRRSGPGDRGLQLPAPPPAPAVRRDRGPAGGQPDRGAPLSRAGRRAGVRRRARDRHRGLVADRPGQGARRPGDHRDRRAGGPHAGPGGAAVAHPAWRRRVPEVGDPGAGRAELRPLRLRARPGRHGRDHCPGPRRAHRPRPRHVQLPSV
ncbi:MAG: oxidoreductase of aldo/keto reductase family, subgroup 1, partial [uncultured Blastococcus sp.]